MVVTRRWCEQCLFLFCCVTCLCLFAEAIDCRRFVFAPLCRGVSAKRSTKLSNEELRELGEVDDSWMDWLRSSPEDNLDSALRNRRGPNQLLQELLEKFHDYEKLRDDDK